MKKSLCIFLLAVLLPALGLGWLALRNAEEQRIILEKRTAELYQKETIAVAEAVRTLIENERRAFLEILRGLLATQEAGTLAQDFSGKLAAKWPRKAIGFALNKEGVITSPSTISALSNSAWQGFIATNSGFLSGNTPATVYPVPKDELLPSEVLRKSKTLADNNAAKTSRGKVLNAPAAPPAPAITTAPPSKRTDTGVEKSVPLKSETRARLEKPKESEFKLSTAPKPTPAPLAAPKSAPPKMDLQPESKKKLTLDETVGLDKDSSSSNAKTSIQLAPAPSETTLDGGNKLSAAPVTTSLELGDTAPVQQSMRNVEPQRVFDNAGPQMSQIVAATSDFRALTATGTEGVVSRFVQDRLEIIFWLKPPGAGEMIFGCLIEADALKDLWKETLPAQTLNSRYDLVSKAQPEFVLALLDEKARPVAIQPASETGRDWKRPFVASEIGEVLPHWEAALYLMHPQQLEKSATALRRNVTFLIAAALLAIAVGGWAVMADARRQVALAQKKTDFVSNVSHELKTPLTSIRMFAELMHDGYGASAEKHPQYLRIIMLEAERLTRLINNVLDFARMERRQKQYDKRPLDLHAVLTRIWEAQEMHLRQNGFTTRWQAAPPPYPVLADEDALAQVLVNLLSNAEKYSGDRKEVELHSYLDGGYVCVSVLDRGLGVPAGEEKKIFEAFYRAHDSLSSGIQGSGLGLTLALRLVSEHEGEILYQPRDGGGSNFTLRLPLAARPAETCA